MAAPYRADQVGSFLRPSKLLDQRAKFARGEIDRTELTKSVPDQGGTIDFELSMK